VTRAPASRAGASWTTLLGCLLSLRFRSSARRGTLGVAGRVLSLGVASGLGVASYLLFVSVTAVRSDPIWQAFALHLFCFLLSLFWLLWPLVAAQVDDSFELGRFLTFPLSPRRLYAAQTLVAGLEPSTLVFYPALLGATLGLMRGATAATTSATPLELAALLAAFAAMNIAAGRCLLNLAMNALSSRRSAELLLLSLLSLLSLAALLPPVDVSWLLSRLGGFGSTARDLALLSQTTASLSWLPPGFLASGLLAASRGQPAVVWATVGAMLAIALLCFGLGLRLLLRFHRARGESLWPRPRSVPPAVAARDRRFTVGPPPEGRLPAVLHKELVTLFSNPKARLLFCVPFFLVIILKIVGAGPLFHHLLGTRWTAVVCAGVGLYALTMIAGQLFANAFGTDGDGVRWVYWTTAPLETWLVGRNLAQALFALAQLAGLWLLVLALFPATSTTRLGPSALVLLAVLALLLGVGDLLSVLRPRRFHFSLARRDRAAPSSVALCLLTASVAASPAAVFLFARVRPSHALAWAAAELIVAVGLYALLCRCAVRLLRDRREALIAAVTRDADIGSSRARRGKTVDCPGAQSEHDDQEPV
jgi:ABC-2 type transport system permease protein